MSTVIGNTGSRLDLRIRQGGTFEFSILVTNPDGSPVNLTGATLSAQLRRTGLAPDPPVATFAIVVTDAVNGAAKLALSSAETAAITCGEAETDKASRYVWDLELLDAAARVVPLLYGNVAIFREVTRV